MISHVPRIFGVMVVRNAVDVVRASLLHHLSLGLERILVVDNGSMDGTGDVLARLARRAPISWSHDPRPFDQERITNGLVADAREAGCDWVVPIDADEFWWPSRPLLHLVADTPAAVLECEVVNFVQHRRRRKPSPRGLLDMTYRPRAPVTGDVERLTESGSIGLVQIGYPPKVIFRPNPDLRLLAGAHGVEHPRGPVVRCPELVVLHAPLRSRATLARRQEDGHRLAEAGVRPEVGWHWRRWSRMSLEGETLDREWSRNSQLDGALDVEHGRVQLVRDTRLRQAAAPWVKPSWAQVAARAPRRRR